MKQAPSLLKAIEAVINAVPDAGDISDVVDLSRIPRPSRNPFEPSYMSCGCWRCRLGRWALKINRR